MKIFTVFLSATMLCMIMLEAYGQKNFLPANVINVEGDTLKGFIDYRNWDRNPASVVFKRSDDSPETDLTPLKIRGFYVAGEQYESAIVTVDGSSKKLEELSSTPIPTMRTDTTFLRTLVSGPKSLFHYKDRDTKDHFFIGMNGSFELLVFKRYIINDNGIQRIVASQRYIGQLAAYLTGCPSLSGRLAHIDYTNSDLVKTFSKYYACTGTKITQEKKEKTLTEWGLLAGASRSTIDFRSDYFKSLVNTRFGPSFDFAGGIFLDIILRGNTNKWSINNEVTYSSYAFTEEYTEKEGSRQTVSALRFGIDYVKLNNMVRFRYPVGQMFVYLNAGVSNGLVIRETNHKRMSYSYTNRIDETKVLEDLRKWEQGILIGIGAKIRKVKAECRMERGNGVSDYISLASRTQRLYLLLGYTF